MTSTRIPHLEAAKRISNLCADRLLPDPLKVPVPDQVIELPPEAGMAQFRLAERLVDWKKLCQ